MSDKHGKDRKDCEWWIVPIGLGVMFGIPALLVIYLIVIFVIVALGGGFGH